MKAGNRMKTETTNSFEEIAAREEQFQLATYKKFPFAPVGGRGSWVETSEGERYLDLYGGHDQRDVSRQVRRDGEAKRAGPPVRGVRLGRVGRRARRRDGRRRVPRADSVNGGRADGTA